MLITATIPNDFPIDLFPTGKGIKIEGRKVKFIGHSMTQTESILETIRNKFRSGIGEGGGANIGMRAIKERDCKALSTEEMVSLKDLAPVDLDNYKVFKMGAANTKIDRDRDKLTKGFLDALAENLKDNGGIGLHFNHDINQLLGKVFHATVEPMVGVPGEYELIEYFYINPKVTLPGQPALPLHEAISDQTIKNVSISFYGKGEIKELSGGEYVRLFDYSPAGAGTKPEHPETSLVYFPAQYGASIKMLTNAEGESASKYFNLTKKSILMPKFPITISGKSVEISAELEGESVTVKGLESVQTEIKALEEKATKYDVLHSQLSELIQPSINNIENLQGEKGLNKTHKFTVEKLMSMTPVEVKAIEADLQTSYNEKFPQGQFSVLPVGKTLKDETIIVHKSTLDTF